MGCCQAKGCSCLPKETLTVLTYLHPSDSVFNQHWMFDAPHSFFRHRTCLWFLQSVVYHRVISIWLLMSMSCLRLLVRRAVAKTELVSLLSPCCRSPRKVEEAYSDLLVCSVVKYKCIFCMAILWVTHHHLFFFAILRTLVLQTHTLLVMRYLSMT